MSHKILAAALLLISLIVSVIAARSFLSMREPEQLYPSECLTTTRLLSDYFDDLKGTRGDTPVYIFEGVETGGTILITGGTHPDEPASFMTAVCLMENIDVAKGRVIIIPRANNSGFTCSDPQEGNPQRFPITTKSGERWFRYGSRSTNPIDQWPDSEVYEHYPSGQRLSGSETRNLNRSYPGRADGSFTEKVAYAIMQVLKQEQADVAVDIHEASLEYPVVNAIVAHQLAYDLAGEMVLYLQMEGVEISLELSPENFRGLSHREWGDNLDIPAVLFETSSTIHGRYHGRKTVEKIVTGDDNFYHEAAKHNLLEVTYPEDGIPLKLRVGRHLASIQKLLEIWNGYHPEQAIIVDGIPDYHSVLEKGIGAFLK